jgi:hypothetical protein
MDDLDARGAPIEYWFFKFNHDGLAFLVDFIVRRRRDEAEVRPSLWIDGRGRIEHVIHPSWNTNEPYVSIGDCRFGPGSTCGAVNDIRWDLSYELGPDRLHPATPPLSWLHPFDTEIINRPQARFTGSIRVGDRSFSVLETPGLVSHYWGRRLMEGWLWISANQFDQPGIAVEAFVARTRLWGLWSPAMKIGYLWVRSPSSSHLVLSPATGIIRVSGGPDAFAVTSRSITGRSSRLSCTASMDDYIDLGEGIRQTLIGTCAIEGFASARGSAGLEWRQPGPWRSDRGS